MSGVSDQGKRIGLPIVTPAKAGVQASPEMVPHAWIRAAAEMTRREYRRGTFVPTETPVRYLCSPCVARSRRSRAAWARKPDLV